MMSKAQSREMVFTIPFKARDAINYSVGNILADCSAESFAYYQAHNPLGKMHTFHNFVVSRSTRVSFLCIYSLITSAMFTGEPLPCSHRNPSLALESH
jgi:hypothetical protein